MQLFIGIIIGLLVLMSLVTIHEFGHFIAAKRNGVKVNEFGIGFPPRAAAWLHVKDPKTKKWHWKKIARKDWDKKQDTLIFSLNFLPIGGFCNMDGESAIDTKKGTFGAASFWSKTKILFAGVTMNWLAAFVILTVLALTGMPTFVENQFKIDSDSQLISESIVKVQQVFDYSPAYNAGLIEGDRITEATDNEEFENMTHIASIADLTAFNSAHAGKTVYYTVYRTAEHTCDNEDATFVVMANLNEKDSEYLLGITMSQEGQALTRSTWSAPLVGAGTTLQLTGETFKGLGVTVWNFISGIARQVSPDDQTREQGRAAISQASDSVSGPVGIVGVLFPAFTSAGPTNLAFLAALISVSLACMNVLPIPALDGGRWLLIAIYKLRKKQLDPDTEGKIVSRAFIVLLALVALITILDVVRLF